MSDVPRLLDGAAALATLRVFGGLSVEEAGEALGVPRATASASGPTPAPG